jgi:hypothetical protein
MSDGTALDHRVQDHNLNCYIITYCADFIAMLKHISFSTLLPNSLYMPYKYNENPQCYLLKVAEQKVISNKNQHTNTHTSLNHHFMNSSCIAACFNPSRRTKWVTSCRIQVSVYHVMCYCATCSKVFVMADRICGNIIAFLSVTLLWHCCKNNHKTNF